jgi:hypothetical protein
MTAYSKIQRLATAAVFAALTMLALAPGASAQTAGTPDGSQVQPRGWEQSTTVTGGPARSYDNGQTARADGGGTVSTQPRGWEATGVATKSSTSSASTDTDPFSISTALLTVAALIAAGLVAFGMTRLLRPHGRPHGVA